MSLDSTERQMPPPASPRPNRSRPSPLAARAAALLQRRRAEAAGASQHTSPGQAPSAPPDSEGWQADLNRVQLTGRLAREPLLHDVGDHRVASLQLVSERRWRTAPGVVIRDHSWHRLTAWEDLADLCGRLLHAGDRIYVEGQLRPISGQGGAILTYEIVLDRLILLARGPPQAREATRPYDLLGPHLPE
ncbi:MAG TPA: single-stranded DNA-binding protein [Chloroflexaceae bacterium]|mgnify:CR=1 FL=1|nr:single-stranded DNA-binding protein [Chloroflexaceae bacterium]